MVKIEIFGNPEIQIDLGSAALLSDAPTYEGAYEVTPKADQKTVLGTAGKLLTKNVTINEVPVWRTPNAAGGNTVYIASERSMTHGKE